MLIARDIHFDYAPGHPVLDAVTLEYGPGVNVIVGPNAAGKSTLLRLLAGLLVPTRGEVTLDARPVASIPPPERAHRVAYIAQRSMVTADFSVREVVALGRFSAPLDPQAIEAAMHETEVTDLADRRFAELSVGQQQRVALARAIAQLTPLAAGKVLLADEPLSALDPEHALATCSTLRSLATQGVCVVAVLHDLTTAMRVAGRASVLSSSGRLAADGPVAAALALSKLEEVFRTRFAVATTGAGPVVVAESRLGDAPTQRPEL